MEKQKTNLFQKSSIVCLVAALCSFLWGSAIPGVKIGYELFGITDTATASQILFAGVRFTLAGMMVVLFGSITHKKVLMINKTNIMPVCVLSTFQTILQYFFFYIGLSNTSGVKASIIVASNVFIAILIAAFVFKSEKFTIKKAIGSVIGFLGILLINSNGLQDGSMRLTGEGFILLSTVAYAMSSGIMKKYAEKFDTTLLSGWQFIFGGVVMTTTGILFGGSIQPTKITSVFMLLYLAFVSAAAYSLWSILLKYNDISSVAIYGFMNPMFGFLLSALLLNERSEAFGLKGFISILLVCLGIFIVNKKKRTP